MTVPAYLVDNFRSRSHAWLARAEVQRRAHVEHMQKITTDMLADWRRNGMLCDVRVVAAEIRDVLDDYRRRHQII